MKEWTPEDRGNRHCSEELDGIETGSESSQLGALRRHKANLGHHRKISSLRPKPTLRCRPLSFGRLIDPADSSLRGIDVILFASRARSPRKARIERRQDE